MNAKLTLLLFLVPFIRGDVCPSGYTQAANGGDCYKTKNFYESFIGVYYPKSFDEVEIECNKDGGGLLTSIHSAEEHDIVSRLHCDHGSDKNIGLRCKGIDCNWDDGSPITYTNFKKPPFDDGNLRCYDNSWEEKKCGQQEKDCWVCKVKAKTIDCSDGETAYKGGCVSVHSSPLDQKAAEASCPGGGHLISIHSDKENDFYKQIALDAGLNGTYFIGGQFPHKNYVFEWTDGSYYGSSKWAMGFPNIILGTCVQMLLASEFGVQGQWTTIDCSTRQPYMCFRDGSTYGPSIWPPEPKADAVCPEVQYFNGTATVGSFYSPNYPLSIPGPQTCEYIITATTPGKRPVVNVPSYYCDALGASLSLYRSYDQSHPTDIFYYPPPPEQWYASQTNVMKIVFTVEATHHTGTGWQVDFDEE